MSNQIHLRLSFLPRASNQKEEAHPKQKRRPQDRQLKPLLGKLQSLRLRWLRREARYDSIATVGEIRVYWRADFQSGSRVLKKVF